MLMFKKIKYNLISILAGISLQMFGTSYAHEIDLENISIKHPMIPIFSSKMKTATGYLTIVNKKNETDELIMVKTDFAKAMMHISKIDKNGIATMEHVNRVIIPGDSSVGFEQGSLHIMFTQLKEPLEEYMDQRVTLVFKNLGDIEVDFQVEKATQKMNMNNNHDH